MNKLITITFLCFFILSCGDDKRTVNLEAEIQNLRQRNDSLESIVNGIKDKYVFDSLTIRQIPNYANTNKLNSIYKEEIVFVGYNANGKTSVIIGDSTYVDNGIKVFDGDTLISKKGAFQHEIKLVKDKNYYGGILKTENEFGKSYEVPFRSAIGVIKN
ncbi:hypothetical protein [Aequorivita sp. KMM 9714]|uniref:hypothetical protein n=1 Tax=Aequorivita sp. KMM 9714 TaxID=2707173 RepID=UPI0013E9B0BE|nr:hypothetical protein [Aequorivita sp. KMM 9714]NGX85053.1 hypothetical protein [Aequorivita sp. KMM 9714]